MKNINFSKVQGRDLVVVVPCNVPPKLHACATAHCSQNLSTQENLCSTENKIQPKRII